MEVSVRELKNHLSEYLRRARAGKRIVVTSHGQAIATLAAADAGADLCSPDQIAEHLASMPWIIPARKRGKPAGSEHPIRVPDGTGDKLIKWVRGG